MKIGSCAIEQDLFFIIEEGQFNDGDIDRALLMIELASKTGANAIEFQFAYADDFYIKSEAGYNLYKNREFSDEQLRQLVIRCKSKNLYFIATCLSHNLIEKMSEFGVSAFNINASDINNPMILDCVAESGLPFFLSSPLATQDEINWAVNRIRIKNSRASFAILHGQHPMASGTECLEVEDTSLGYISTLKRLYNVSIGYIDHTPCHWMPAVAVAAGASIISKHMSPSRLFQGPDWQICLEPSEMKMAIDNARAIQKSIIVNDKRLAKGEDMDRSVMRRSIVSSTEIPKGMVIDWNNILFKRPGTGIPPHLAESIIGKKTITTIKEDSIINLNMLEK